jgi:NADPH:quinone reductase-like Zn-dependent oxidoreductase
VKCRRLRPGSIAHHVYDPGLNLMRALQFSAVDRCTVVEMPDPTPQPGEALVVLRAAALNHRDVWIKQGKYAGLRWPCVPGSDGAGEVVACGAGVDPSWVGRAVVINPSFGWGDNELAQGAEFSILGLPRQGTLAERIAVPVAQLAPKPQYLSWEEAAALPLAGLTAYRSLFSRARLQRGERVLISGVGGGVALFLLQFAVMAGAEAWVTSSSADKIARAVELGARGGFNYTDENWAAVAAKTAGFFEVVVDSAGGPGFASLVELAAPGGRLVLFGATRGDPPGLAMRRIFWRQLSLLGSTMGSPADWQAMLAAVNRAQVRPVVSATFPLARAAEALSLLERGAQFGKVVVTLT